MYIYIYISLSFGERMVVRNKSYSYRKKYFSAGKVDLID